MLTMREVRPPNAPLSWAADVLSPRLMARWHIRIERDAGVIEGLLDQVDGTNVEVIDANRELKVIPSSDILAFEIDPPADHSDELRAN